MSGGSYHHLYCKEDMDVFSYECIDSLEEIADDLEKLGYAEDVAKETMNLLLAIRASKVRIEAMKKRLDPIFRAMELWQSCDTSEDFLKHELKTYRGGVMQIGEILDAEVFYVYDNHWEVGIDTKEVICPYCNRSILYFTPDYEFKDLKAEDCHYCHAEYDIYSPTKSEFNIKLKVTKLPAEWEIKYYSYNQDNIEYFKTEEDARERHQKLRTFHCVRRLQEPNRRNK